MSTSTEYMKNKKTYDKLISLFEQGEFYYSYDDIIECKMNNWAFELTKKAYGDSYDGACIDVFGMKTWNMIKKLSDSIGLHIDDYYYAD